MYSTVSVDNSIFLDNVAASVNHGFTMTTSNISFTNSTINYTLHDFLHKNTYEVDTGFFNCRGAMASFIYATGKSQISIGKGTIIRKAHSPNGDVISMSMSQSLIIDNVTFHLNSQRNVKVDETALIVTNSRFNCTALNAIKALSQYVRIVNNTFEDLSTSFHLDGGKGIDCDCFHDVLI